MTTRPPAPAPPAPAAPVHRVQISTREGFTDARADRVLADATALGYTPRRVRTTQVYLLRAPFDTAALNRACAQLLADPVTESAMIGTACPFAGPAPDSTVEVHPLPGVMDPVAQSVSRAIAELSGVTPEVSTGWRYDFWGLTAAEAQSLVARSLANPIIHRIHAGPWHPAEFARTTPHDGRVTTIPILELDAAALQELSRRAHLFLSLEEMLAIQSEYRRAGRNPTDIELETLAQTWSEHCVHKTLKSTIRYRPEGETLAADWIRWQDREGHEVHADGSVTISNLLKSTVAAATFRLIREGVNWTLSVFSDNSGVVAFDDQFGVCIKVETHNHPSALEPYGGAATGIGGCIRDVMGTGLGAKPIAATDVFCVAPPDTPSRAVPAGTLHPRRVLSQVVAGVRDYGNRMGIPTVSGAVAFDPRYIGNPLVFCGCVGLIPRHLIHGAAKAGDRIVALGGRTGRDGIHGATFSSAELEHSSADEFSHAVQIGNAIEEKRALDALLRARDEFGTPLYSALTDCGAGGFSSAVGEMGKELGAEVHLDRAPLKYDGLSYHEIWISEAQERMVLAVPPGNMERLRAICAQEHVEIADLGRFGTPDAELVLHDRGREVGRVSMAFLHDGIPTPVRDATWAAATTPGTHPPPHDRDARTPLPASLADALLALLAHPDIASKHWIIRQYDHEVQGNTLIKPLCGPGLHGPSDASVVAPVPNSRSAIALACGLQTPLGDPALGGDPYLMALAAIDECVRNLVCAGADPGRIAILDNFCWPSCGKPRNLGALVRAAEGCYDGALAYRTPFVSGKDSLNNQLNIPGAEGRPDRTIEIPYTLLITGLGFVPDAARCITMDAKRPGNALVLIGPNRDELGASRLAALFRLDGLGATEWALPPSPLPIGPRCAGFVASLIERGIVEAAHDVSEGGPLTTVAEMLIAASGGRDTLGARIELPRTGSNLPWGAAFGEGPSRYVLEVAPAEARQITIDAARAGIPARVIGTLDDSGRLSFNGEAPIEVARLMLAWRSPLDW
ncbi:MAG: phosphoribosylformylglycinamidine synthase [Phycisphaerae bacterium]|nr:phosphoribosylformylglycinamidine synthase [Phycisphaerae bacterium]